MKPTQKFCDVEEVNKAVVEALNEVANSGREISTLKDVAEAIRRKLNELVPVGEVVKELYLGDTYMLPEPKPEKN